jgi:hemolysin activation/secretion protein
MQMPFQLTLGGEDLLRGYTEEDFPGGQRLVVNLEDRIRIHTPLDRLVDLGATVFADGGVAWAGDVPYGEHWGLQGNVGVGVRMGFPAGTRRVVRFDFAWPMGREASFDNLVFRITGLELLGLITGTEDRQLRRSRRSGVAAGLFDSPVR